MIGVLTDLSDHAVVREFFELFKTPWEFYREGRYYDVVLCSDTYVLSTGPAPRLVLVYTRKEASDAGSSSDDCDLLQWRERALPLYCGSRLFPKGIAGLLTDAKSGKPALRETVAHDSRIVQIGYDLFREIQHLLTLGQPVSRAANPTLEVHVALLRELIVSCGIQLIEVPPLPLGYPLVASLTHDVDHPFLRRHKFDRTMFGFIYRATIGSLRNLFSGRASYGSVLKNWMAVVKLPLVYLGFAKDPWSDFDRYVEIERPAPSSYYAIPFKNLPGLTNDGAAPSLRGAAYGVADISAQLDRIMRANCEIGLHGIDAWADRLRGREELDKIRAITGVQEIGVRMHWLYFNESSPALLESAGASYDSSIGFNETVGYRAGTSQAYKPLNAAKLLELPLEVMDTALFYPSYMDLSPKEAKVKIDEIIENTIRYGGCVTVNWHDRSIAPERLWEATYIELIQKLRSVGAWFATASQVVRWFRLRRSVLFEWADERSGVLRARVSEQDEGVPGLRIRIYPAHDQLSSLTSLAAEARPFYELPLRQMIETCINTGDLDCSLQQT